MNLGQLLARVARGPVGDLAIGGAGSGTIPGEHVPRVVEAIQVGLTALYRRFPMALKTLTIAVVDGLFEYPLRAEFAQSSGSAEPNKFILDDVARPFTGDVLMIEHVLDSTKGGLPLNNRRDPVSWFTSAYDTLAMDYPVAGDTYFVQYRADHAPLTVTLVGDPAAPDAATLVQEVRIPPALLPALLAKVAYELFCDQTGENATLKAQEQDAKFNNLCAGLELENTLNSSVVEDRADMVKQGGWA